MLNDPSLPPTHPVNMLPGEVFKKKNSTKFASKLTFEDRCAILGLIRVGVDRRIAAIAFEVDRRTVTHINNPHSMHYRDVRKQLTGMGLDHFVQTYVTPEVIARVQKAKDDPSIKLADNALREEGPKSNGPNPRAKGKAGIHVLKPEQCSYSHRIEIGWRDEDDATESPAGWHYRDLDGEDPDVWFHNGEESLLTSQNALRLAEANLVD